MSPYQLNGPAAASFSGGRSSGYMTRMIQLANGGKWPEDVVPCFANTGKEMPQTLDFVQACSEEWGIPIVWLELASIKEVGRKRNGDRIFDTRYRVVDYNTASRNGEPFDMLVDAKGVPNPAARFCTADLKTRRINQYLREGLGWEPGYQMAIGIRADEPIRVAKNLNGKSDSGEERVLPMHWAGVTRQTVSDFWQAQDFDLQLPNNNGTTDWGNCDLCFLKGLDKKWSIIRERPDLAHWWSDVERRSGSVFRKDHPSITRLIEAVEVQPAFPFLYSDETIPCMCGD